MKGYRLLLSAWRWRHVVSTWLCRHMKSATCNAALLRFGTPDGFHSRPKALGKESVLSGEVENLAKQIETAAAAAHRIQAQVCLIRLAGDAKMSAAEDDDDP